MNILEQRLASLAADWPSSAKVLVWGQGEIGQRVRRWLQQTSLLFVGFVDKQVASNSATKTAMATCVKPHMAVQIDCDYIVLASIRYADEIAQEVAQHWPQLVPKLVSLSPPSDLQQRIADAAVAGDRETLTAMVFDYPDDPRVWQALKAVSTEPERLVFGECATLLTLQDPE